MFILEDFLAGWFGGTIGLVVGHPVETIKVRQQIMNDEFTHTVTTTYKFEGIRGFYKGLLAPLLTIGPSNSIFFGTYANCIKILEGNNGSYTGRVNLNDPFRTRNIFIAGLFGGFMQLIFTCPIELVKTIQQSSTGSKAKAEWKSHFEVKKSDTLSVIKHVFRKRGMLGFYRGFVPMMFRDVPAAAAYISFYEMVIPDATYQPAWKQLTVGGIAGVGSWMITIPFDVIKSRIQSDDPSNPLYKGMIDCIKKSYKAEGPQIFMKGFWLIIARAFPVNAAVFLGYESSLKFIRKFFPP